MSKHTPGPWKVTRPDGKSRARISGSGWGIFAKVVVRMKGCGQDIEEGWANARLIAAAPAMYAFIESMVDASGPYSELNGTNVIRDAYAILSQAEGREMAA
jgi:hypothetical protein